MNLDDLQKQWQQQPDEHIQLPVQLDSLKKARNPVEKIRQNMKNEFWFQLIGLLVISLAPALMKSSREFLVIYYSFLPVVLAISGYYLTRFFRFYRDTIRMDMDTRKNLYRFYFEMKLNIEAYKAFNYCIGIFLIPLGLLFALQDKFPDPFLSIHRYMSTHTIGTEQVIIVAVVLLTAVVVIDLIARVWVEKYYAPYVRQIEAVLNELEAE
ncbi:hypothetical protein [Siphonobacter aquaeclarae]|jgi:hypothetical protein|uniref:Uncharacterized protein n=1 Tax=Siphonobacter aquaeclarae TaxID=563176 RepID=A0A1G9XR27_9BACT|nr:hypothetical protein [Siphonobacter aquaeclarae]SDM99282.1 hypothetical protein SAMN04488090_4723 [Siphonobacter aquaeclarae]